MSSQPATCAGCGKLMIWGRNVATGNMIPLDASAPVYRIVQTKNDGSAEVERVRGTYVSHFSTCRAVDQFKRAKGGDDVPSGDGSEPNGTGIAGDS